MATSFPVHPRLALLPWCQPLVPYWPMAMSPPISPRWPRCRGVHHLVPSWPMATSSPVRPRLAFLPRCHPPRIQLDYCLGSTVNQLINEVRDGCSAWPSICGYKEAPIETFQLFVLNLPLCHRSVPLRHCGLVFGPHCDASNAPLSLPPTKPHTRIPKTLRDQTNILLIYHYPPHPLLINPWLIWAALP